MAFISKNNREPLSGRKLRERALDLLSRRDHSERELKRKLLEKGGQSDEIESLVQDLAQRGYLDDRRFAENFVRFRADKAWGKKRYRQELFHRGVEAEVIDEVLSTLAEVSDEVLFDKLKAMLAGEARKKRSEKQVVDSLLRRGFSMTLIRRAFED